MKTLRYVVFVILTVVLLASCVGLPPVIPAPAAVSPEAEAAATEPVLAVEPTAVPPEATAMPEQPEATVAATESPEATVEATVVPEATAVPEEVTGENPLTGVVWEWAALLKTQPASQAVVPSPANYTLIFSADGDVLIKADCNNGRATYELTDEAFVFALGPVTRASCPPGSLSDDFLTALSTVGSFVMDGDDLIVRLSDSGDSMIFRNGGPSAEPAAPPATEAPAGAEPPAATATPAAAPTEAPAEATAVAPADTTAPELLGTTWQWESLADASGATAIEVSNPENYTVTFNADGTASMQADCNQAGGAYTLDGSALTIGVGPMTLMACAPGSLGEDFLVNITNAGTYVLDGGKLILNLIADSGDMVFRAAP